MQLKFRLQEWRKWYTTDRIFKLTGWTDCHTYDATRIVYDQEMWYNISPKDGKISHPFVNSVLGDYMDHLKGPRKQLKKSKQSDLKISKHNNYWKK